MKYFKINLGYSQAVQIDETELPKVMRAQQAGGIVYLKEGVVNTKHISSILPDWNKVLEQNPDYRLEGEDYSRIEGKKQSYRDCLENIETLLSNSSKPIDGYLQGPKKGI
jgi:hypothetical protein